jgi:two-component system, LuxR family, response regulator FixJ
MALDQPMAVHIVDDDEAIRRSIGFLLRKAGYEVATYATGTDFLRTVTRETRGCVLLDVRMPDIDGFEVQKKLSEKGIGVSVIMLTGHGDVALAVRAVKSGAVNFLEKPFERSLLLAAIDAAMDHAAKADDAQLSAADATVRLARLTTRERDVLHCMVQGRANKLIAFELKIAQRTVEVHRANLMEKLNARSLSEVLKIAFAAGLSRET